MNIDTLNAYCGNKLVLFPYLTQGRFNIYQAMLELDSLWPVGWCYPKLLLTEYLRLNSWDLASPGLQSEFSATCVTTVLCRSTTDHFST